MINLFKYAVMVLAIGVMMIAIAWVLMAVL